MTNTVICHQNWKICE